MIRIDFARSSEHDHGWSAVAYSDGDAWSANAATDRDDGLPELCATLARAAAEHVLGMDATPRRRRAWWAWW